MFVRADTLAVAFQLFGLTDAQKKEGTIRYVFTRNDQTALDRSRPLAEFPDLPTLLAEFPLSGLPPAHYALRVSVVADGRELVAGTEEFDVSFQEAVPRPWYHTRQMPPSGDPGHDLVLGSQLFNAGRFEEARARIENARARLPDSADAALALGRIEMALDRPSEAAQALRPFLEPAQTPRYDIYVLAGQALFRAGDSAGALDVFNRATAHFGVNASLLNAIGECFVKLGRPKDARTVWERSLEFNPSQPEIRKKLEAIKDKM